MDLRHPAHYVAGAMELLLALLSLLTAATGALTGARAPEMGVQAVQVGASQQAAPRAAQAERPAPDPVLRSARRDFVAPPQPEPARAAPLYADRLIE